MTGDAAEVVRASFRTGSVAEAASYWHEDVEYQEDPMWPGAGTYAGRDAVTRRWEEYVDVLGPTTEMTRGTTPAPHERLWGYLVRMQDGKLRHIRAYYDPDEALRAAGLSA